MRRASYVMLLILLGLVSWAGLWSITTPRAGYDTLWYEMFGLRYSGADESEQVAGSWAVFAEYADPEVVALVDEANSWPCSTCDTPRREKWVGIFQMRPLFPVLVALTRPVIGDASALAPSVVAVLTLTLAVGLSAPALLGVGGAAVVLLLSYANPLFSAWLVHLTADGLGLALWAAVLLLAARWIHGGSRRWLAALFVASLVAAFTRQSGVVVLMALGSLMLVALWMRRDVWRRFAAAAVATAIPLALFAVYVALIDGPSFADILQDVPTRHFQDPDRPNIPRYLLGKFGEQAPILLAQLFSEPQLWIPLLLGVLGLVLARAWWAWLFVTSLLFLPVLHFGHPLLSETPRTFAPAWFNIHVGIAALAVLVVSRYPRILRRSAIGRAVAGMRRGARPAP